MSEFRGDATPFKWAVDLAAATRTATPPPRPPCWLAPRDRIVTLLKIRGELKRTGYSMVCSGERNSTQKGSRAS